VKRPSRRPARSASTAGPSKKLATRSTAAVAGTVALVAASLVLSACSERSPINAKPYAPSDGVDATLSSLDVRDLLVVSAGANQPGVLSGALVNSGTSAVSVTFQASGQSNTSAPVPVPAGGVVELGSSDGQVQVQIPQVQAAPGALTQLQVTTPGNGPTLLGVPVLDPTLQYATITPTPEPTTSSPTDTATASPSSSG
jgi:hypothetical protein